MDRRSARIRPGLNPLHLPAPPHVVEDHAFERVEEGIRLSCSILDPQPDIVQIRLYQCPARIAIGPLIESIARDATDREGDGYLAGDRIVELGGVTLDALAEQHGLESADRIWNHPVNGALARLRGAPDQLTPTDTLYIPHAGRSDLALPVGPALTAERIDDETVEGGVRWGAVWSCEETGYDPLDSLSWKTDLQAALNDREAPMLDRGMLDARDFHFPRFAIRLDETDEVHVSPSPPELVTSLQLETEEDDMQPTKVVMSDGSIRDAAENLEFTAEELPIAVLWS
jgi:hypothetical protein